MSRTTPTARAGRRRTSLAGGTSRRRSPAIGEEVRASAANGSRSRWGRRFARLAAVVAGLALIGAAAVWFWRDLPRRKVESALAARLSADVSVGRLSVDGLQHFVLSDLVVRRMAGQPRLETARIATLDVTGSLGEIQQARFRTLRAEGAVVRLVPPDPTVPLAEGPGVSPTVETLTLDGLRVILGSGPEPASGGDPAIVLSGTMTRIGGDLGGTLTIASETLPIESLLAQMRGPAERPAGAATGGRTAGDGGASRLDGIEGRLAIADGGARIDASARAARLVVAGAGGPVVLASPSIEASVRRDRPDGPYRIEIRPVIPLAESLSASAVVDARTHAIVSIDAVARSVDVAPVLALAAALPEGWKAEGRADLTVKGDAPILDVALDARLSSVEGRTGGDAIAGKDVAVSIAAKVTTEGAGVSKSAAVPVRAELAIGAVRGTIQGHALPESLAPVTGTLDGTLVRSGAVATTAGTSAPATPGADPAVRAAADALLGFEGRAEVHSPPLGRIALEGRARAAPDADLRWRWEDLDLARLAPLAERMGAGLPAGVAVEGRGRMEGTLRGTPAAPSLAGSLRLESLNVTRRGASAASSAPPDALTDARAQARFAWTGRAGPLRIEALDASGRVRAGGLEPFEGTLTAGALRVDPFAGAVDITNAALDAKGIARVRLTGSARRPAGKKALAAAPATVPATAAAPAPSFLEALAGEATVHADGVDLARLQKTLRPWTGDLAPGYAAKGDAEADASLQLAPGAAVSGRGKAVVRHTGFSSSDGSQVLEGLDTSWDLAFAADLTDPAQPTSVHATADVSGFQLLWGSLFVDGATLVSKLDVGVDLARAPASRAAARVEWTFPDGPRFAGTAVAAAGAPLEWTVEAESRDLATTFAHYVRAPLGDSIAFFRRIEASGTAHVEAHGRLASSAGAPGSGPSVSGRVRLGNMRIAGTEKVVEVTGLDLDLPFDLAWGPPDAKGARRVTGSEQKGSLRFGHMTVKGLDVPETSTGLRVRADTVEIEEGVAVPLLDGAVGMEKLRLVDLLRPERHLESAVLVSGVSLARASRAFSLPPLEGSADAYFPHVTMSMDMLAVDGGGEVHVFGGTVKLGAISGEDILSRFPKFVFSADFSGIDLEKLTHTFDFGEMTGIVQGYVHDCELFRGVPTAFDARVETEERRGVSRTVNVKAIQNLTILGTGTSPNIFDRGIQRFLDKYTYSRIGIATTLKDDVFMLRGLERRGDQELFVKGRLPFPINVVNAQPGAPISFQDMIERVKNLDVTAATVR